MKERFNVEIVGISFSVVTDDGEEIVRNAEATLNRDVTAVLKQMGRFSKLDAVTLCALDYCAKAEKAESKIKNLEAQIEILESGMNRRKADSAKAQAKPEPKEEPKADPAPAEEAKAEAPASANDSSRSQKLRQLEALLGSQLKIELDK